MLRDELICCIGSGDLAGARRALAAGADPNALGPDGLRALQSACLPSNGAALAAALCEAGADPLIPCLSGEGDLLEWACAGSHWAGACSIAAALPHALARRHCLARDRHGLSLAAGAAALGDLAALLAILRACPEAARAVDNHGADPFWHACESSSPRCAAALAAECDLAAPYPDGASAAHMAAKLPTHAALEILLSRGARCDGADDRGRTALHCAAFGGSWQCAALAIEAGAEPAAIDEEGQDACSLAARMGHGQAAAAIMAAMEAQELGLALAIESRGEGEARSGRL